MTHFFENNLLILLHIPATSANTYIINIIQLERRNTCQGPLPTRKPLLHVKLIDKQLKGVDWSVLARSSGFEKRTPRKIDAHLFLKCLWSGAFQSHLSLSSFAFLLSFISGRCVSKQALAKRINDPCVAFVKKAIFTIIDNLCKLSQNREQGLFMAFNRVLIQDSTHIPLPDHLSASYPGARNQYKKKSSAGMKIQVVYNLLSEQFIHFSLSPFSHTDQAAAPDILHLGRKGDLVLRDLGYFVLPVFKKMITKGIFFLSRLRQQVILYDPKNIKRINLLAELIKYKTLDIDVLIGQKERVPLRLVAVPVPESVANERRRKAKTNRDKRLTPTKESLRLLNWQILITNVDRSVWNTKQVIAAYMMRWRIETIFKAWKSHFHITAVPTGSKSQVEIWILAKLLSITLFQVFFDQIYISLKEKTDRSLSLLKFVHLFALLSSSFSFTALTDKNNQLMQDILRVHCTYEKRKKRINFAEKLCALS
jgi:hypothetical protein